MLSPQVRAISRELVSSCQAGFEAVLARIDVLEVAVGDAMEADQRAEFDRLTRNLRNAVAAIGGQITPLEDFFAEDSVPTG